MTNTPNVSDVNMAANVVSLAVKASYGTEIRRAPFTGNDFATLRELCSKLFELDPVTISLKYQDDDGDKITMSSDAELQDALRLSVKDTKVLRVFVELKAPIVAPNAAPAQAEAFPCGLPRSWAPRGSWRGSGRHFPHHGFGHPGGFSHHGRGGFPPRFGGCPPFNANSTQPTSPSGAPNPNVNFYPPTVFNNGVFSDVSTSPSGQPRDVPEAERDAAHPHPHPHHEFPHHPHPHPHFGGHHGHGGRWREDSMGPYAARCAFKERKHAMKEQIKLMKENASTPEDREEIKEIKKNMKEEWKQMWQEAKDAKKEMKCHEKREKKCHDEREKKCKDKHEKKHEKHERKCKEGKEGKFIAKHVADITVPDNSELPADAPVTKIWRLRNAGEQPWPEDSQLIFISHKGDNLNGPERVHVGRVEPGMEVDVSMTFITPADAGRYVGYYRMATGAGDKFGQRLWIAFFVAPLSNHAGGFYPNINNNNVNNNNNNNPAMVPNAAHAGALSPVAAPAAASPSPTLSGSIDVTMD